MDPRYILASVVLLSLLAVVKAEDEDCSHGKIIIDETNLTSYLGCYSEKEKVDYKDALKHCSAKGGYFDLRATIVIVKNTFQDLIENPGEPYFLNVVRKDGVWVNSENKILTSFKNFPNFTGDHCHEGSHLVWIPTPNEIVSPKNRYGKLSCIKKDEEAHSFCITFKPRCTSSILAKSNGDKACYFMINRPMGYFEAADACQTLGAQLPEPRSASDEAFIDALRNTTLAIWYGADDNKVEGTFVWMSDNSPIAYSNWATGEPNNQGGFQNCVYVLTKWNDVFCFLQILTTWCEFIQ